MSQGLGEAVLQRHTPEPVGIVLCCALGWLEFRFPHIAANRSPQPGAADGQADAAPELHRHQATLITGMSDRKARLPVGKCALFAAENWVAKRPETNEEREGGEAPQDCIAGTAWRLREQ